MKYAEDDFILEDKQRKRFEEDLFTMCGVKMRKNKRDSGIHLHWTVICETSNTKLIFVGLVINNEFYNLIV